MARLRNGVETITANIRKNYHLDKLPRGKQRGKFLCLWVYKAVFKSPYDDEAFFMTDIQKDRIREMRAGGCAYIKIAEELGILENIMK